jgi:F0F1-type ATP synthase membrane subunit b/b'
MNAMSRRSEEETLSALEENQAELRRNIEASNELIAKSDALLDQYRAEHDETRRSSTPGDR